MEIFLTSQKSTTEVCLGKATDRNGISYITGRFYPAGNVPGHFHENLFPPAE